MTRRIGILALVGAIGVAHVLAATVSAQSGNTIPGGIYRATTTESTGCDEGDIITSNGFQIRLNAAGTRVVELLVNEVYFQGALLGRPFMIQLDAPIALDGTFSGEIPLAPATIESEGRFEGDTVSGTFRVTLNGTLECAATFTGRGEPPPEREPVGFVGVIEATGDCGGGIISLTISGDMRSVQTINVDSISMHGTPAFGSGRFAEDTVPIAEDGSFGWTYFAGEEPGQEIAVLGSLSSLHTTVTGAVTVSPSECGALPFDASTGLPTLRNDGRGGPEITSLGQGGTGPGPSDAQASRWLIALAAAGAALLGLGVVSLAKR